MNSREALDKISWRYVNEPSFQEWCNIIKQDLDRLESLETFKKLCLTKYVPLDCLSPSFWNSKKEWLEDMSYDYYLYLCEDVCEYVVKDSRKLTPKEFKLIYDLLKEELENDTKRND